MRTNAIKAGDSYFLNGTKTMISNGPVADRAIVFAVTDEKKKALGGTSCFLVSRTNPVYSTGKPMEKMGLRTLENGELIFTDCQIPRTSILGHEGQGMIIFNESMEWERTLIP